MHRLRKDRAAHRRIRPGLLALALAGLAACTARAPGPSVSALPPGTVVSWYQLQAGAFTPAASAASALPVIRRPWTVQARVADMAFLGDTLYAAINGAGLATIGFDAAGAASFAYHADALIFNHRTVSALVPRQGTIAVHLYYNVLLNDARPEELALAGIGLVTYLPATAEYSFLIPPFQQKNMDWEAVGFAAESENSFDIEWKYTDAAQTRFAYTRYHADTKAEETVERDTFLNALGVPSIAGATVPKDLASFFESCRARITLPAPQTALQFSVRSRESPVRRNYRSRPQSDDAVGVPVFEEKDARYALLPAGDILSSAAGASVTTMALPRLPEGFRYTDVVKIGSIFVVPWEEISFTDVGRAGVLLLKLP